MTTVRRATPLLLAALALVPACREDSGGGSGAALLPSTAGANGCSGPDQVFTPPQTPSAVALAVLSISPTSQITADATSETLYATGAGGQVVEIDVSGAPVETELVAPGVVAGLLGAAGIATAPAVSGIAVLDADTLLVVEQTSNTILAVDRNVPDTVAFFAGQPNEVGGYADTPAVLARFNFDRPTTVCPTGSLDGRVYVADTGNHVIRAITDGFVSTVAGIGSAFYLDGQFPNVAFDTPTGLSVRCSGTLLVTELGLAAAEGNRLRQLIVRETTVFGTSGMSETLAGDGTAATIEGDGELAQLAEPASPLATSGLDVYWVDSATGILRRMTGPLDTVDCPLWTDCATAVASGGNFTPFGVVSLTETSSGLLFVLDATGGTLWRVTP